MAGLAFLLMQQSCGTNAARKASRIAVIWCILCTLLVLVATFKVGSISWIVFMLLEGGLVVFYLLVWLLPYSVLFRRPAAISYSRFWVCWHLGIFTSNLLVYLDVDAGFCVSLFLDWGICGFLKPLVVFYTLLADSNFWRGLFLVKNEDAADSHSVRKPLIGTALRGDTASSLAIGMEEMEQGRVELLNFAFLSLGKPRGCMLLCCPDSDARLLLRRRQAGRRARRRRHGPRVPRHVPQSAGCDQNYLLRRPDARRRRQIPA
jgi:hypothetical protein